MTKQTVVPCHADIQAVQHLREAIGDGKHWYVALLEAIGLWGSAEEVHDDQYYRYLVAGEAFDWLLLTQRLCSEVDGLLPEQDKISLLFFGAPPVEIPREEFRDLVGDVKYRAYLNYVYGVVVEEALVAVFEEDVHKEHNSFVSGRDEHARQEAHRRIYGADMTTLLDRFRHEIGYPDGDSTTLLEQKEFTYWLFKYRLDHSDRERIASDTKKALDWLQRQWASRMKPKSTVPGGVFPQLGSAV
jgi:hypothetical protein